MNYKLQESAGEGEIEQGVREESLSVEITSFKRKKSRNLF